MSDKPQTTVEAWENLARAMEQMRAELAKAAANASRTMADFVKATRR